LGLCVRLWRWQKRGSRVGEAEVGHVGVGGEEV
jgi:hypothetical protein